MKKRKVKNEKCVWHAALCKKKDEIRKYVLTVLRQSNLSNAGGKKTGAYFYKMKCRRNKPETDRIGYLPRQGENEWKSGGEW